MGTVWTFGDSYTDYYSISENSPKNWKYKYVKWKGYQPKVYGEVIAEKLNYKLINKGLVGADNLYIIEEFCKVCELIKEDDIVIFGWTAQERVRLSNRNNEWGYFNPHQKGIRKFYTQYSLENFDLISPNTIEELIINKKNKLYTLELLNWIKLINFSLKNIKRVHWSWCENLENYGIYVAKGYKPIRVETNNEILDGHWCEESHYLFADEIIKRIFGENINTNKNLL